MTYSQYVLNVIFIVYMFIYMYVAKEICFDMLDNGGACRQIRILLMEEILRIESLNSRGLRDETKRCDVFDKARSRQTDILLLQETHWTITDYTDLKENWNIEILILGNSTAARGTAILLNKTF